MMQYFKIDVGKFIEFDPDTGRASVLVKADLISLRDALKARINEGDPGQPTTNAEWVIWAKAHYPYVDHSAEIAELNKILAQIEAIKSL